MADCNSKQRLHHLVGRQRCSSRYPKRMMDFVFQNDGFCISKWWILHLKWWALYSKWWILYSKWWILHLKWWFLEGSTLGIHCRRCYRGFLRVGARFALFLTCFWCCFWCCVFGAVFCAKNDDLIGKHLDVWKCVNMMNFVSKPRNCVSKPRNCVFKCVILYFKWWILAGVEKILGNNELHVTYGDRYKQVRFVLAFKMMNFGIQNDEFCIWWILHSKWWFLATRR